MSEKNNHSDKAKIKIDLKCFTQNIGKATTAVGNTIHPSENDGYEH